MSKNSVAFVPLTTLDASLLNAVTWRIINPTGLPKACIHLIIVNNSNTAVELSTDEATQMVYIAPNSQLEIPIQTNAGPANWISKFAAGTVFYARGTAGVGAIALMGLYNNI